MMKQTKLSMLPLAIVWMLAFCTAPSDSVPIIPGWEEDPIKYTIDVFAICDYYCARALSWPNRTIADIMDKTSRIMGQLNLEINLVGLEIWDKHGWTNWTSYPKPQEFNAQIAWIGRQIDIYLKKIFFDELILFTGMPLMYNGQANVIGMNIPSCISNSRCWGVVGVSDRTGPIAFLPASTAHELGHAFGVQHDTGSCACANGPGNCLMNPASILSSASNPIYSDCSKDQFKTWANSPNGLTIRKPTAESAAQFRGVGCGNGVVDEGEECDCGPSDLPTGCSRCCVNCKLAQAAQCAAGMCCDTPRCKFFDATQLCRRSRDEACDDDDFCSGNDSECKNVHRPDWSDCTDFDKDTGYCKEGFCNTINTQCRFVWDKDYKAASKSCFNSSIDAINKYENSTTTLQPMCHTLICGGNGNNDGLHPGRNPQRTYLDKDECLTGRYLEVERALLGLSGTMMVEDGTKCAEDSACFAGECLPKSSVISKMKAEPTFERKTSRCGDGRVDPGEDCDCGPRQCECCEITTCKLRPQNMSCIGAGCGMCDGKTTDCDGQWGKASDFKFCSAESTDEVCFDGDCRTLSSTCAAHFWLSDILRSVQSKNAGQSSQNYNAGGFFLTEDNSDTIEYEEYSPGEGDGVCGIVHCQSSQYPPQYFVENGDEDLTSRYGRGGAEYPVKQFSTDGGSRVLYYRPKDPFDAKLPNGRTATVNMYVPLMADEGQACTLPDKKPGYCRKVELKSKQIPSITYDSLKCSDIPIPPSYENLYPFNN